MSKPWFPYDEADRIAGALGLNAWTIHLPKWRVKKKKGEWGTVAETRTTDGYARAWIVRGDAWDDMSRDRQRDSMVHEFGHVLLTDIKRVQDDILEHLPKGERHLARKALRRAEETACDSLARGLTPILWPKPEAKR